MLKGVTQNKRKKQKRVDVVGIDPATCRMRSDRSTIWATHPRRQFSTFDK